MFLFFFIFLGFYFLSPTSSLHAGGRGMRRGRVKGRRGRVIGRRGDCFLDLAFLNLHQLQRRRRAAPLLLLTRSIGALARRLRARCAHAAVARRVSTLVRLPGAATLPLLLATPRVLRPVSRLAKLRSLSRVS